MFDSLKPRPAAMRVLPQDWTAVRESGEICPRKITFQTT
jgi:hypothetical protein